MINHNKYENDEALIEHFVSCKTDILYRYINDSRQTQQIIALTFLMGLLGLSGLTFLLYKIIKNNSLVLDWVDWVYLIPTVLSYLHLTIGIKTLTQDMLKELAELNTLSPSTRIYIAQLLAKMHSETNPNLILKKIYQYLSIQGQHA